LVFFILPLIDFKIYSTISELPDSWNSLPTEDQLLKKDFLKSLEESYPKNISAYYLGVFKSEILVGIAIIQRVEMYIDDVFRQKSPYCIKQFAKDIISGIVKGNALVVGNLMHTGQHGIYFNPKNISQQEYLQALNKGIGQLSMLINKEFNKKIRIIAFKDYFNDDEIHNSTIFFKLNKLYKVQVQPNMIFSVNPNWESINDYILDLNKKYRRRYKTAIKKGFSIEKRELNAEEILKLNEEIFSLYKNVSDNAGINTFILSNNHFLSLKAHLEDNFKVYGYFKDNKLIGFYSLILNNKTLETYFLGYNPKHQRELQMYLNMLYDMAKFAIENNFETVVYARTAMEIKSSIGAKPHTMHIYLKHTNNLIANTVLKLIVKYMNPIRKWEERHPFK